MILMMSFNSFAQVRVLIIDAGTPDRSIYPTPGNDYNKSKEHYHGRATYQFVTMGSAAKSTRSCIDSIDTCSFTESGETYDYGMYYKCLKLAAEGNYDIVNMSLNGNNFDLLEMFLMMKIEGKVVVAAGNEGYNSRGYPSQYSKLNSNIIPISALTIDGERPSYSNYDTECTPFLGDGYYIDKYGDSKFIQGTSVAAALYTNRLINKMCKEKIK